MKQRYLTILLPDDQRIAAIAEESQLRDADLDQVEAELRGRAVEPSRVAALALTVGRAGRAASRDALGAARGGLVVRGRDDEAAVVELALELLLARPPPWVERAERGYRRIDPRTGAELFVEDPLAAHWHHEGRWGPPLAAEAEAPQVDAAGAPDVDALESAVRAGRRVRVEFGASPARPWAGRLELALARRARGAPPLAWALEALERRGLRPGVPAPLYLVTAGLARDPSLSDLVRWSEVESVGRLERGARCRAAYERRGAARPTELPESPSLPVEALVDLMTRMLARARA